MNQRKNWPKVIQLSKFKIQQTYQQDLLVALRQYHTSWGMEFQILLPPQQVQMLLHGAPHIYHFSLADSTA